MAKGKGISFFKGIVDDMRDAVDKAIDMTSGAKKARLQKQLQLYNKMYKNANKFGARETMRRDAVGKPRGEVMKGATRVTESTG